MSERVNTLVNRYRRWRRYRETLREIETLSPHELEDIGISTADIRRRAREAAGR